MFSLPSLVQAHTVPGVAPGGLLGPPWGQWVGVGLTEQNVSLLGRPGFLPARGEAGQGWGETHRCCSEQVFFLGAVTVAFLVPTLSS